MTEMAEPEHRADEAESAAAPDAALATSSAEGGSRAAPSADVGSVLEQVKERGFITTGEIFAAFPDLEPDADELRDLWDMFESRGIKVLDEIAEELQLEDQRCGSRSSSEPASRRGTEHRPSAASRPGSSGRRVSYSEPDDE